MDGTARPVLRTRLPGVAAAAAARWLGRQPGGGEVAGGWAGEGDSGT